MVFEGAYEADVMLHGAFAGTAIRSAINVDPSVGTTTVGLAIVVPGNTGEGGLLVAVPEATRLSASAVTSVPEVDMLDTAGHEAGGARLEIPSDIVNLVLVTLLLERLIALCVKHEDMMVVVEVSSRDPAFSVDSDAVDSTRTLSELHSLFLLASAGIPGEDGRLGADLSRDSCGSLGAYLQAHDIVSVMVLVIGDILGSVSDLTTTEELLGVGLTVEDDTEGGSHVDSLSSAVEVDILLGVGASVAVDVLKLVGDVWFFFVDWVVAFGLSNLTNPGTNSHELLTRGLFYLEEVVLTTVVILASIGHDTLACLFVVRDATTITLHVGVIVPSAWGRGVASA